MYYEWKLLLNISQSSQNFTTQLIHCVRSDCQCGVRSLYLDQNLVYCANCKFLNLLRPGLFDNKLSYKNKQLPWHPKLKTQTDQKYSSKLILCCCRSSIARDVALCTWRFSIFQFWLAYHRKEKLDILSINASLLNNYTITLQ